MRTTYEIQRAGNANQANLTRLMWLIKYVSPVVGRQLIQEFNWRHGIEGMQDGFLAPIYGDAKIHFPLVGSTLCQMFNWSLSYYGYEHWERVFDSLPVDSKQDVRGKIERERRRLNGEAAE